MSFTRARALQSLQNGLRQNSARPALRTTFRRAQMQAKRFASSEHGHEQKSDLPWLLGALVVTPPSVYYLWPSAHSDDHHDSHEKHDDDHGVDEPEEKESGDDDEAVKDVKEESSDEKEDKSDDEEEKPDDKSSGDKKDDKPASDKKIPRSSDKPEGTPAEGEGESKPAEGNGNTDGVNFKGKVKEDSDGASHSVKVESDSKGAAKKRIDSGLQKNLGPGHEQEGSDRDTTTMDGKQKGLSNTQSRHSIPIHEDPEKSKKPDGTPDTSKHIGTVDGDKN